MSIPKGNKMLHYVNYRMRVTLDDSRTLVGRFLAFDTHMNIVLVDCEEFRRSKKKDIQEKRALGFVLIRGDCVISVSVEQPPPPPPKKPPALGRDDTPAGRGVLIPAGRGTIPPSGRGMPAPGLAGPVPGVGAPAGAATTMQPHVAVPPRMYPPGVPAAHAPGPLPIASPYGRGQHFPGAMGPNHRMVYPPPTGSFPPQTPMQAIPPGWGRGSVAPIHSRPPHGPYPLNPDHGRSGPPPPQPPPPPSS